MYTDYRPARLQSKPLITDVQAGEHPLPGDDERNQLDRDYEILERLRERLRGKREPESDPNRDPDFQDKRPLLVADQDRYEPQRIDRKICWQYTREGRKVPLFRRNYIDI